MPNNTLLHVRSFLRTLDGPVDVDPRWLQPPTKSTR